MRKKICVITGSRAEYGLLYPLLKKIKDSGDFILQLLVTGSHFLREFGLTYREIESDGFKISERIEMLLSSDTKAGITKSLGIGLISFSDCLSRLKPDMVVVLGDRFEIFAASQAVFIAGIPLAHIHGGELTEGAIDDAFRHSITKMSLLHFTSTEEYRRRVIQLGELPARVFNTGALAIDNIKNLNLLKKDELQKELGLDFGAKTLLVTFHPATLEENTSGPQFKELLKALDNFKDLKVIFTKPNADIGAKIICSLIDDYVGKNSRRAVSFTSLGRIRYLSTIKYVNAVVGNSSSGIIEAPALKKPTVNIGDRQKGRVKPDSVIDCPPMAKDIRKAISRALSVEFKRSCKAVNCPYGDGHAAEKIYRVIKKTIGKSNDFKKSFYDLRFR